MRREARKAKRDGAYPQRLRLFRSDFLEQWTLLSFRSFVAIWAPLLLLIFWAGWGTVSILGGVGLVAAGLLTWSLFEYAMHRYLFHLELESRLGRRLGFLMHGNHHADPSDPHRNLMPPIISLTWASIIWIGFVLLLGRPGTVVFLGFIMGYVVYDSIHYACHQSRSRSPMIRALRRHHLRHHHSPVRGNYAITTIFWDKLFGSYIPNKAVMTVPSDLNASSS